MARLDDLEDILGITFDTEEFETLNGFLINEIAHLPEDGEQVDVHFKGYRFTTSEQDNNVLRQILIEKEEPAPETAEK
jgi:putative hemolysin